MAPKKSKKLRLDIKLPEIKKSIETPTKFELSADKDILICVSNFNDQHYTYIRTWVDGKPTKKWDILNQAVQRYAAELDQNIYQLQ